MVWMLEDFEREIGRQLIELASIRKRVLTREELFERLDRLEESQQLLIRKVRDYFGNAQNVEQPAGTDATATSTLRELNATLQRREQILSEKDNSVEPSAPEPAESDLPTNEEAKGPAIGESCALCGKPLISSLLAGEPVTQSHSEWMHSDCHKAANGDLASDPEQNGTGQSERPSSALN